MMFWLYFDEKKNSIFDKFLANFFHNICIAAHKLLQAFIQTVLEMFFFEERMSFRMLYLVKNDQNVTAKCR